MEEGRVEQGERRWEYAMMVGYETAFLFETVGRMRCVLCMIDSKRCSSYHKSSSLFSKTQATTPTTPKKPCSRPKGILLPGRLPKVKVHMGRSEIELTRGEK